MLALGYKELATREIGTSQKQSQQRQEKKKLISIRRVHIDYHALPSGRDFRLF